MITAREIYDQLTELTATVNDLSARVDHIAAYAQDHEKRLRALERRVWQIPSATVLIALAALIVTILLR